MKTIVTVAAVSVAIMAAGLTATLQAQERHQKTPRDMKPGRNMPAQVRAQGHQRAPEPMRTHGRAMPSHFRNEPAPHRPVTWERPAFRSPFPFRLVVPEVRFGYGAPGWQATAGCQPVVQCVQQPVVVSRPLPATETVWVVNSNGSRTPVELRRTHDGMYVGPRGEYYLEFPTNEQLRRLYGF